MSNAEIARSLREIALYLDMDEIPFKPRAYEKAAYAVEAEPRSLEEMFRAGGVAALREIPGVGKSIAAKIAELVETGRIQDLEAMRQRAPVDLLGLTAIEGLGPHMVKTLHQELGIRTIDDLEEAARAGRIRELAHFGEKSEERLLRGLDFLKRARGRVPIGRVLDLARGIEARLGAASGVEQAAVAGSLRRHKETIGDLDFLVAASDAGAVSRFFATMPEVLHVHARGESKVLVRLKNGIDADLRIVPAESFGAALMYFTGSKAHNVALRRIAMGRRLKLNEYGLFRGTRRLAGGTEEEVYGALGLPFIPPELREDRGEIEAAQEGRLPRLVEANEIRGDLQTQTTWTDGACDPEQMAVAARDLGLTYVAITDHTRDLAMTGLDSARLLEQRAALRRLDRRVKGIRILSGAEVNIRRDGSLDIEDEVLAQLDVVGAAVHSHLRLPRAEMTRRLIRAMENPHVDILFHPTSRALGRRPPVDADMDALIAAAARTGTVLEIDAQPERLDLSEEYVRQAREAGALLVIDSDAHSAADLRYIATYGVPIARRGWATRDDILNTLDADAFLARLKGGGRRLSGRSYPR